MDQTILEQIKTDLTKQKAKLEEELRAMQDGGKATDSKSGASFPKFGDSEDDNAAEVATFSDRLSIGGELSSMLRDINGALKRIADGTYGICKYCKKEIDPRRLLARPFSSSCVNCKEEMKSR